jgi:hypothetical protein
MWHLIHLFAKPIEALLGFFCVVSAIVLYPDEEGKIQSRFEDFWVRVDDFQNLALTRHAAFMTQVARLETRFLDRVFGRKLFSAQAIIVSCCCSLALISLFNIRHGPFDITWWKVVFVTSMATGVACIAIRDSPGIQLAVAMLALAILVIDFSIVPFQSVSNQKHLVFILVLILIGGFVCDVLFIAMTRRLVRWMRR